MIVTAALPAAAQQRAPMGFEAAAFASLNLARSQPLAYAAALKAYRAQFHDKVVSLPGQSFDYRTEEGVVPVDEAISLLSTQPAAPQLQMSAALAQAAADLAASQEADGDTGHGGEDAAPGVRLVHHGGGATVAEVIAYGATSGEDAIRQLIVDDGVAERDHRAILFQPNLRYAGVACRQHPELGTVCVIDLSDTPDGGGIVPAQVARR